MVKIEAFFVMWLCGMAICIGATNTSLAWGPEDESWRRQQEEFRRQTAQARRMDIHTAFGLFKSGKAVLISVDSENYYKRTHILGSTNIPSERIDKAKLNVPINQVILVYCR